MMEICYDIKDANGVTDKERNLQRQHNIPLGALVEVVAESLDEFGCRLFVVRHSRDCDGTPLYDLSFNREIVKEIDELAAEDNDFHGVNKMLIQHSMSQQISKHYAEESLVFINF